MAEIAAERRRQEEALRRKKKEQKLAAERVKRNIQELKTEKEERRRALQKRVKDQSAPEGDSSIQTATKNGDTAAIQVRLENGLVFRKVYAGSCQLRQLFQDVLAQRSEQSSSNISLVSVHPKREFCMEQHLEYTFLDAGLLPQASLMVKTGTGGIIQGDKVSRDKALLGNLVGVLARPLYSERRGVWTSVDALADEDFLVVMIWDVEENLEKLNQLSSLFPLVFFGSVNALESRARDVLDSLKVEVTDGYLLFRNTSLVSQIPTQENDVQLDFISGGPRKSFQSIEEALSEYCTEKMAAAEDQKDAVMEDHDLHPIDSGEYFYKLSQEGLHIRVHLKGSPGNGYFWKVTSSSEDVVVEEGEYTPGAEEVGIDGEFVFQVSVIESCRFCLMCEYSRPWLKGDPALKRMELWINAIAE